MGVMAEAASAAGGGVDTVASAILMVWLFERLKLSVEMLVCFRGCSDEAGGVAENKTNDGA